ncbi:hypothetical protein AtubIFM55763_008604 [Aspergillus tubingensis]|uniref:RNA binding protein n=1 Tax=Aspergillus niger TaxID=5061 RepID=A0A124BY82_ASPNG|nr:RNA binding protein [Aspergillus niger]GLA64193.1 hypothetical protein AtubIFM54640_005907 [Aspergillus tubingensis]GLA76726.1 hypothetical protein AtubIFM55763_008604 [Aspergillus tubingensis]GLA99886.1 hypothetical protein AtubIFM57143_008587 [Aspergillus tubingensis]
MGASDKKRKLAEEATSPEVKKAKREDKKEKKEKKEKKKERKVEEEVVEEVPVVEKEEEKKEKKKDKKDKKEKKEKKEKKDKKEKKEKKSEPEPEAMDVDETPAEKEPVAEAEPEVTKEEKKEKKKDKKEKKDKKDKKSKKEKKQQEETNTEAQPTNGETEEAAEQEGQNKKNARFICFVGNLPYSADKESLTKHFEKITPVSVRVATQVDKPTKCRGFGFIEFDNYDRMKTCLKLYHHSMFNDGKYPPRRINVELTAGGGGNSKDRKEKIEAKNKKLFEERQRNAKEIQKEKQRLEKVEETGVDDYAHIHPSRRPRMA